MQEDQMGSVDTDSANQDDIQEGQVDSTEEESQSSEETTTEDSEDDDLPEQYRGKSKQEIVRMHQEAERLIGNRREVEEKARAYEQLTQARRTAPAKAPDINQFTDQYGNVDVSAFNQAMNQYQSALIQTSQEVARKSAREELDTERIERDFPDLANDRDASESIVSMYESGRANTLYEAAKRLDKIRKSGVESGVKEGAKKKEKEITGQMRSSTEKAGAKIGENLSSESFASLSLEEKKAYLEKHF